MAIKEKYVFCNKLVINNKEQQKIIQKFKSKFASRNKECAVLIVHSASAPNHWMITDFNEAGQTLPFDINALQIIYYQKLRYLDTEKKDGNILRDSLYNSLHEQIKQNKIRFSLPPASLIASKTCQLQKTYGIKCVFHITALDGSVEEGYEMMDELINDCVRSVFTKFTELAKSVGLETILMPMLGAFSTSLEHLEVVRNILNPVVFNIGRPPPAKRFTCSHG